jgi:prepilin-type N-terminal cleavage/methylation domain-containing protein
MYITDQTSLSKRAKGFTLVEMAVVLVILGLLTSAFLAPLSVQRDIKDYSVVRNDLEQMKEAIYGFAVVNGHLPCPDTNNDGLADACANINSNATSGGGVPWATLGLENSDPWGRSYQYRVNNAFTDVNGFNLDTIGTGTGIIRICIVSTCTTTQANNVPVVIYSLGKNGGILPPGSADEIENIDGDRDFVNRDFAQGGYDDIVVWVSINVLMNKMVSAGKLPKS